MSGPPAQPTPEGAFFNAVRPVLPTDPGFYMALTTVTAASVGNIAAGAYAVTLDKSKGICLINWGASVAIPTSGAAPAATAIPVRDGDVIVAPGGTPIAAILTDTGSTGSLGLTQLA